MVPDRWQQWNVRRLKPLQNRRLKAPPHGIQLLTSEASHLTRDHVASTHHQIRLQANELIQPLIHGRDVAGGAIAAVEIADQPNPLNSSPCGAQGQGRCRKTGAKHQLQHPATTQQHNSTGVSGGVSNVGPASDRPPGPRWQQHRPGWREVGS